MRAPVIKDNTALLAQAKPVVRYVDDASTCRSVNWKTPDARDQEYNWNGNFVTLTSQPSTVNFRDLDHQVL